MIGKSFMGISIGLPFSRRRMDLRKRFAAHETVRNLTRVIRRLSYML